MTSIQNTRQNAIDPGYITTASVILLLIHYFVACNPLFQPEAAGPFIKIFDRLHEVFQRLPLTGDIVLAKGLALLLMTFSFFAGSRSTPRKAGFETPSILLGVGLLMYFGSIVVAPVNTNKEIQIMYIVLTSAGYLLCLGGISGLSAAINYRHHQRQLHHDKGFAQEEKLIETEFSLNFRATYYHNGRQRKSWINIINPRRGVLIMGSPGSGKSWYFIESMIQQLIWQGRALFVYDFKYPTLSQITYHYFLEYQQHSRSSTRFYCINFTDLSASHRCNLVDPPTLRHKSDATGISKTILLSMNRIWAAKQGDFFVESAINYLAALIWFLRVYQNGIYCTLPHVVELSKVSYDELFTLLNVEPETRGLIGPFKDAYLNKTMEMLDSQVSSARIPLSRIDSPDFYYILSGNDLQLDINDPNAPIVLCLGGDPERQEALAPVLSLYIDRLNKRINKPGKHPCALILDEFATVRATSVLTTIATGRSNDIIPILAIQDLTQLTQQYSHDEAHQILNTAGNLICGQVSGETARLVSQRFQSETYLKTTVTTNSRDTSVSQTEHSEETVTPASLAQLSAGEFIGVVADDPDTKLETKGFYATLKKPEGKSNHQALPIVSPVTPEMVQQNFQRIVKDIQEMVESEMKRIVADPSLKQYIVRR